MNNLNVDMLNGNIELGTRMSLILTAIEVRLSLDDLVLLDYALLYSKSYGGPENLHPALPNHIAEIGHRREFLPASLDYFINKGLIDMKVEPTGYYYKSNSQTVNFVSCLRSRYYKKIWVRLEWLKRCYLDVINSSFPIYQVEIK